MFTLVVPPESPCGCGSGRAFGECCLQDGRIRLFPQNITPPLPRTGLSFEKCLFSTQNNCGGKMSGEHILSASVLKNISNKKIQIKGSNFIRTHSVQSNALKTKCLCQRHNSACSPLDSEAGRLFKAVRSIENDLSSSSQLFQQLYLFEGFDIERWLLKTLFAVYRSGITGINSKSHILHSYLTYFFDNPLNSPYGLYLQYQSNLGDQYKMLLTKEASFTLITFENIVSGITVELGGLELKLIVAGTLSYLSSFQLSHVFRPKYINFFQGSKVISIAIAWIEGTEQCIWLSNDPTASIPQDI